MATKKSLAIVEPDTMSIDTTKIEHVDEATLQRRNILRDELAKMNEREEKQKAMKINKRKEAVREAKEKMSRETTEKGITILPDSVQSREEIKKVFGDEYRLALREDQCSFQKEKSRIQATIDTKLGISALPKGDKLMALAADFYNNRQMSDQQLPEHIRKSLTTEEIKDFWVVFEMFDAKNKVYITADDLRRAAAMLGFTAKKRVFKEMINDISKDIKGRVTFVNFLELVIKLQGDGSDHYDEIQNGFCLLDRGGKGFLTFSDVRAASEALGVSLSRGAINDMLEEADMTGDGKVTATEFLKVITQAETFTARASDKPLHSEDIYQL